MPLIPKGRFTQPIHKVGALKPITKLANWSLEVRRAILLKKRLGKLDVGDDMHLEDHYKTERDELEQKISTSKVEQFGKVNITNYYRESNPVIDGITIIDIDAQGIDEGVKYIKLPFVPKELNWNSTSNFVAIKPMGRNNPKYHFTGSEDVLEFEIDWHSFDSARDDVIKSCRLIEALSKNDAYNNPPHRILLSWGYDNVLFRDIVFVVTSAPYRMTQFNKAQFRNNTLQRTAMLPIQAYQKVTLARITSNNLSSKDIQLVSTI